jgi:hypothetical protein
MQDVPGQRKNEGGLCRLRDGLVNLFGYDFELPEPGSAEGSRDRYIGRVAPGGDQHPSNTREIVPRIESPPFTAKVRFEPRAEIHGARRCRHAYVSEIASGVSGRYVHGAAKRDGEVLEIPADSAAFDSYVECRPCGAGEAIAKHGVLMDPIADRLNGRPSGRNVAKQIPSQL